MINQLTRASPPGINQSNIHFLAPRMRVLLIVCCFFSLLGCQTPTYKKPPVNDPSTDATIQLAEAAISISQSMRDMATVEKVIYPHNRDNHLTIPNIPALQMRASVDWAGPIEELVRRIAKSARLHFHILGKPPAIPVLVNISAKDELLVEILRNIDYQAANRAAIRVYPHRRLIELRYEKPY